MQTWPPFISRVLTVLRATRRRSASSSTTTGDFPPSSSSTGVRFAASAAMTWRAVAAPPVKASMSQGREEKSRASSRSPVTTAASAGSKRSATSPAIRAPVAGMISGNRIMTVFPAAIASMAGSNASEIGALNGVMTPTTPSGSCMT